MRCVLLCILEGVEGSLCLLEVMRCVLLGMLEAVQGGLYLLEVMDAFGGDALCATLYSRGSGG